MPYFLYKVIHCAVDILRTLNHNSRERSDIHKNLQCCLDVFHFIYILPILLHLKMLVVKF